MTDNIDIKKLKKTLSDFAKVRDWNKFHNPKNLVMATSVEVAELVEIFQWLTEKEALTIKGNPDLKINVSHEIADIMLYLIRLCDILDIEVNEAIENKIAINTLKYPANKVKGSAKKYSQY